MKSLNFLKSKGLTIILVIAIFITIFGIFSLTPSFAKRCEDGWEKVCCGPQCIPGDYCMGSGTYCCCK